MTEHTEEFLDLCAELAVGSIEPRDRQRLAEHIAEGCLECDVALADFEQVTLLLVASAPAAMPAPELRDRLLAAAAAAPTPTPAASRATTPASGGAPGAGAGWPANPAAWRAEVARLRRRRALRQKPWNVPAVAAGLALVALIAVLWGIFTQGEVSRLRRELASNYQLIGALNQQLEQEKAWNAVMSSPDARMAELRGTPQAAMTLHARAAYDPHTQRAVFVFENLLAPRGRVYELWVILDRTPQSLGLIQTDGQGRGVLRVENVGEPDRLGAFEVSMERSGGSRNVNAPSGPIVLLGKLEG